MAQTNQTVKLSCEARTFPTNTRIYWLRLRQAPSANSHYEFLALWIPNGNPVYGKETEKQLTVLQDSSRYLLQLRHVKPADSGNYFCMAVGNPELTFGKGTRLSVGKNLAQCRQKHRAPTGCWVCVRPWDGLPFSASPTLQKGDDCQEQHHYQK